MTSPTRVVVVGGGQAGGELVAGLRSRGFDGSIRMVTEELAHPYSRPPLSKAYLRHEVGEADLPLRSPDMYATHEIDVLLGARAVELDRTARRLVLADGSALPYDVAVLATGGAPRRLPDPRLAQAPNVHHLRTVADATALRRHLVPGHRLTVIGGGYIGLEVAAVASTLGVETTIVEREPRLLSRSASAPVSAYFARVHASHGVRLCLGTPIVDLAFGAGGALSGVRLADGELLETDVCLIAVGLAPTTELAERAGLAAGDGILVDHELRTSDPAVHALGDVARQPCPLVGGTRRLESINNAHDQAAVLADVLTGRAPAAAAAPWFWSDQYDLKLQTVGRLDAGGELVTRPAPDGQLVVLHVRDARVRAAEVVGSPRDFAAARTLVNRGTEVDVRALADPAVPLRDLARVSP